MRRLLVGMGVALGLTGLGLAPAAASLVEPQPLGRAGRHPRGLVPVLL